MEIRKDVLEKIIPSPDEQKKIDSAVDDLLIRVRSIAEARNLPFKPVLVGSVAKGTHLKDPDIDLFLRFPQDVPIECIGEIDKDVGREILDSPEERYAEHAYISGRWRGFKTDLVPCYDVASGRGRISAVDRTPFHTEYVTKILKEEQKDDVRLFKQFLKGIGAYGAEAKIQGFSGYLCEILILKFGGFNQVISVAGKWKIPITMSMGEKSTKKFDEPFDFIDPVDPGRNVASPISSEKISLFIEACKSYRKNPSLSFFFPKKRKMLLDDELEKSIKSNPGTVLVDLPFIDVVDDVLWPQLRKTGVSVFEILEREGFAPDRLTLDSDVKGSYIIIDCKKAVLPENYIHFGPPAKSPEAVKFRAKWKDKGATSPVIKKGRWQVKVRRLARSPEDVLLLNFGSVRLGKGFRKIRNPVIVSGDGLFIKKYRRTLSKHFDKRRPWET